MPKEIIISICSIFFFNKFFIFSEFLRRCVILSLQMTLHRAAFGASHNEVLIKSDKYAVQQFYRPPLTITAAAESFGISLPIVNDKCGATMSFTYSFAYSYMHVCAYICVCRYKLLLLSDFLLKVSYFCFCCCIFS